MVPRLKEEREQKTPEEPKHEVAGNDSKSRQRRISSDDDPEDAKRKKERKLHGTLHPKKRRGKPKSKLTKEQLLQLERLVKTKRRFLSAHSKRKKGKSPKKASAAAAAAAASKSGKSHREEVSAKSESRKIDHYTFTTFIVRDFPLVIVAVLIIFSFVWLFIQIKNTRGQILFVLGTLVTTLVILITSSFIKFQYIFKQEVKGEEDYKENEKFYKQEPWKETYLT